MKKRVYQCGQVISDINHLAIVVLKNRECVCLDGNAKAPAFIENLPLKIIDRMIQRKRLTEARKEK